MPGIADLPAICGWNISGCPKVLADLCQSCQLISANGFVIVTKKGDA